MRDERRAQVLERLAAGDVIVVAVAVDHVLDRLLGDLLDLVDVGRSRPAAGRRPIGSVAITPAWRDDEHRLMALVAEDVDVVGAFDLGGGEQRRRRLPGAGGVWATVRSERNVMTAKAIAMTANLRIILLLLVSKVGLKTPTKL